MNTATATTVKENTVVALGFFDGVHIGHRHLLKTAVEQAKNKGISALVLTFSEEGSDTLKSSRKRIFEENERIKTFRDLGISYVGLLNFEKVKDTSPEDFVSHFLIGECRAETAVCGFNFRYGKGAKGNAETLIEQMRSKGRDCIVCEPYLYDGDTVSSSRIRERISAGDMQQAKEMLGRNFFISSAVTHGKELGREIGFPTANQALPDNSAVPRFGVYATRVTLDGKTYNAVTNVGVRPTFDDGEFVNCETHIIDYAGDLYGKILKVEFCKFLREEREFSSVQELKEQIDKDRNEAKQWLIATGQD